MTTWLLNSAVLPCGGYGNYRYSPATWHDLSAALARHGVALTDSGAGEVVSRIGYEGTATLIGAIAGRRPPTSRELSALEAGDTAWVVRLRYRVGDPSTKGQPVSTNPDDWEIARLERLT